MNGTEDHNTDRQNGRKDELLAELFRHASARPPPPAEDELAIRQNLHEQWQQMTQKRSLRSFAWPLAIAASVLLAVVIGIRMGSDASPVSALKSLAVIQKSLGSVSINSAGKIRRLAAGSSESLLPGQTISTDQGSGLALDWVNGAQLRLGEGTQLELVSADEVMLREGKVYLDTQPENNARDELIINTPQGQVKHLGTQFITRVTDVTLEVSVREGEVQFLASADSPDQQLVAGAGQLLEISPGGDWHVEPISTWGENWQWTEQLASGFQPEGHSLADVLDWVGRETGRTVEYSNFEARSLASDTAMHGAMELKAESAVAVVSATSDLAVRVVEGQIRVELKK